MASGKHQLVLTKRQSVGLAAHFLYSALLRVLTLCQCSVEMFPADGFNTFSPLVT